MTRPQLRYDCAPERLPVAPPGTAQRTAGSGLITVQSSGPWQGKCLIDTTYAYGADHHFHLCTTDGACERHPFLITAAEFAGEEPAINKMDTTSDRQARICFEAPCMRAFPPLLTNTSWPTKAWGSSYMRGGKGGACDSPRRGAGALLMPLHVWGAGDWDYLFTSLFIMCVCMLGLVFGYKHNFFILNAVPGTTFILRSTLRSAVLSSSYSY
eukprot:scaffold1406_cov115-Isochrysis_galbana.AAC.4